MNPSNRSPPGAKFVGGRLAAWLTLRGGSPARYLFTHGWGIAVLMVALDVSVLTRMTEAGSRS